MARDDQIDEFWRCPNFRVPGIMSRWNRVRSQKTMCNSPRKWPKMTKTTSFGRPNIRAPGVMSGWNHVRSQKLCAIAHENGQKWPNRRVLTTYQFSCTRVMSHWNRVRTQKLCAIAHKNGQKWPNRWVLTTSQFSCTSGHQPLKSSPEPKTVCYRSQKRPEMTKSTSFDDVPIFVYSGSRAVHKVE